MLYLVDEEVLWLEVPVDDGESVEVLQRGDDLHRVELGSSGGELARLSGHTHINICVALDHFVLLFWRVVLNQFSRDKRG